MSSTTKIYVLKTFRDELDVRLMSISPIWYSRLIQTPKATSSFKEFQNIAPQALQRLKTIIIKVCSYNTVQYSIVPTKSKEVSFISLFPSCNR